MDYFPYTYNYSVDRGQIPIVFDFELCQTITIKFKQIFPSQIVKLSTAHFPFCLQITFPRGPKYRHLESSLNTLHSKKKEHLVLSCPRVYLEMRPFWPYFQPGGPSSANKFIEMALGARGNCKPDGTMATGFGQVSPADGNFRESDLRALAIYTFLDTSFTSWQENFGRVVLKKLFSYKIIISKCFQTIPNANKYKQTFIKKINWSLLSC